VAVSAPPISVLLPVRDAAVHLGDCIASLESQTDADFEVIAVDDGSRDGSRELLHRWAGRDPRVRVVAQEPLGLVAALERARAAARGRWLARMDADDVAHPARFAAQRALMERDPTLALCGSGVRCFPRAHLKGGTLRYERWLNGLDTPDALARDLFVECPLAHPTFFMRADALAAVGGYRDRGWPEDYDLVLRLWRAGGGLGTVPEPLLDWRERPDRLSRTHPSYGQDAFQRCKAHHLAGSLLRGRGDAGVVVWGAGPTGKGFARALTAEGIRLRAFVDIDPDKIGQEIQGVPVIAPDALASHRDAFCVAAVGQPGARPEIRAALAGFGWEEGSDFVAVA
jgi:cellulose synthase/poly-beta-1,6-N-acetylglucosamine synthase-like glycosyltransferase